MTDNQKEIFAAVVIIGAFIIPELDAAYIMPKMKETGHFMEVQCRNEPNNCWIQKGHKK